MGIEKNVECEQDSVCIYELGSLRYVYKVRLGIVKQNSNIL